MVCEKERALVLVVEDDPTVLYGVEKILTLKGCDVITANNGLEALELLNRSTPLPCLIFLDLMMPVMDGWQFLERLRQEKRAEASSIPVVVVSASSEKMVEEAKHKSQGYLKKPFRMQQLLTEIEKFCP